MKRIKKLFLFFVLFLPVLINASVNYNDAVKYANNYIYLNDFPQYRNYLEVDKYMPYLYDDGSFVKDTSVFKNVGFINKVEFDITNIYGNSYLSPGLDYWTMTSSSAYKKWVVNIGLVERAIENKSRVRVTQFTKSDVKVSGSGTYGDPWEFLEILTAHLKTSAPSRGLLANTSCSNEKEQITLYATDGEGSPTFMACPKEGFRYRNSSCIVTAKAGESDKYYLNFNKNNVLCSVNFGYRTYLFDISCSESNCTNAKYNGSEIKTLYLAKSHNSWFRDQYGDNSITKITIPSKVGYTFKGYYTSTNGGGTQVINASGDLLQMSSSIKQSYNENGNNRLYPDFDANKYNIPLNSNGATSPGSTSVQVTYDSAMPSITKPTRSYTVTFNANGGSVSPASSAANYTFNGYYYNSIQYYTSAGVSARTWNVASAATLTANWTSKSITLPTPTRDKHTFLGWYTADSGGTKIGDGGAIYTPTKAITLYAQWKKNCTTYNCCPSGGTLYGSTCYSYDQTSCGWKTATASKCKWNCGRMSGDDYLQCGGTGNCSSYSCTKNGYTITSSSGNCGKTQLYTCSYTARTCEDCS